MRRAEDIIFPYSEEYAASHTAFAERMWPEKRRRRDPAYNRWKFRGPAKGPVDGLLLAVVNGQVVGQLGLIPVTLLVDGREYQAQWACDLMVDSTLRRQRLGSLLLSVGIARPVVTLGSNPSPLADAAMSKAGFRSLPGPRNMILPLKPLNEIVIRLPHQFQGIAPLLSFLAKPLIALHARKLLHSALPKEVCRGSWMDVIDQVQGQNIGHPHIAHDLFFLRWRGQGILGFSPELMAISTPSGAFAIIQGTPRFFFVYEWHASSFEDAFALFRYVLELAVEQRSQTITVLANSSQEQDWLARLGFFATRTPYKIIYYPEEPLSTSNYFHYCLYDSDGNL